MTVPWGILKGDSIINELNLGDGMAWWFIEKPSEEDSVHTICQTGDVLTLYACGLTLEKMNFTLNVSPPKTDMAKVFPLRHKNFPDPNDPWGNWVTPLYVTEGAPVIDTIGNAPYAMRVDSLYEFLEKAPGATWTIEWVDGVERVDLKYGDKLIVTAEDNTTIKEYFIDVQEIQLNSNADLAI